MTLAECEAVERQTGTDWSELDPVRSAAHARAVSKVLIARFDRANAEQRADNLTVRQLLDAYSIVDDDLPVEFTDGIPPVGVDGATVG